jgi:hypothetical protein
MDNTLKTSSKILTGKNPAKNIQLLNKKVLDIILPNIYQDISKDRPMHVANNIDNKKVDNIIQLPKAQNTNKKDIDLNSKLQELEQRRDIFINNSFKNPNNIPKYSKNILDNISSSKFNINAVSNNYDNTQYSYSNNINSSNKLQENDTNVPQYMHNLNNLPT